MIKSLKPAEYLRKAREIASSRSSSTKPIVLAVLSSFTAEILRPYLIVEGEAVGVSLEPWFGPYGQFEQVVMNDASSLYERTPSVVWLAARLEDVDESLIQDFPQLRGDLAKSRLRAIVTRLTNLASQIRRRSKAYILVSDFACPPSLDFFESNDPDSLVHLLAESNRDLAREIALIPGAHVFPYASSVASVGVHGFSDQKLWYLARTPIAAAHQPWIARRVARAVRAITASAAKCIVVDLDDTLWGGVLGDDGPEGIQLGGSHPGNVFVDIQRALLQLRARGFLLAIVSKNYESTVQSALMTHPEMIVRPSDFAAIFANWDPKPVNLRRIAETLQIGLDSLVFLDNNPIEQAQVRSELPMVHVLDLDADPMSYVDALVGCPLLDRPRLLAEDCSRAEMYQQESQRRDLLVSAQSVEAYLADLQMTASLGRADTMSLERVHQLLHKTNQFNLTTRRYTIEDVRRFDQSAEARVAWLRLRDRLGEMGIVCVGIIRKIDDSLWEVDSFLMSCRVMGRRVEDAFLSHLFDLARTAGAKRVRGIYRPTAKNHMVKDFYSERGFIQIGTRGEEVLYEREPPEGLWPSTIRCEQV